MVKILKWFFGLFSFYASSFERKVDRFFRSVKSSFSGFSVQAKLKDLMQKDLVVVNLWMEKKYKGYKYLKKSVRRRMYIDSKKIVAKFNEVIDFSLIGEDDISNGLRRVNINYPNVADVRLKYIFGIMQFLKPGKYYNYIKTSSFGKLLVDPDEAKLEGDCNQIVTLYIFLYAKKYDIADLKIKLLPEHVCLHYNGIDIEATNGTFQKYSDNQEVLPVTEIVSTNLLDLADFREKTQTVNTRVFLKAAQLAYSISSLKELVTKNLNIAYNNLAISALNEHDFDGAIFYFSKLGDSEKKLSVYKNAAVFYMNKGVFDKALFYAKKLDDSEFLRSITYNYGISVFKAGDFQKALGVFSDIGDENMKRACYSGMYNKLHKKVVDLTQISQMKKYKSTYRDLLDLAYKIGDERLIDSLKNTLRQL